MHHILRSLEAELLVHDLVDCLARGDIDEAARLFHPEMTVQADSNTSIVGRASVAEVLRIALDTLGEVWIKVLSVGVSDTRVLADCELKVRSREGRICPLIWLCSFQLRDHQILSWRQLIG